MRTGDVVTHHPTGEEWVVAMVDEDQGDLSWCGWPEGYARISDCTVIERCSDDRHWALLRELAAMQNTRDHRCRYARRILDAEARRRDGQEAGA